MPRNASGIYTLASGNPVDSGTLIEASWANNTLNDLASAMTDSLSRNGEGGMLAPFRLADGTLGAPGIAWTNEPATGFYRSAAGTMWGVVGGAQILQYTSNGILIPSTKTLTAQGNASVGGNLSVTGTLAITGGVTFTGNASVGGTLGVTGATTLSSTLAVTGAITATGGVVGNVTGNVSGNAGTVTNGVYTSGLYADPAWITSLSAAKLTGTVALATGGTGASTAAGARTNLGLAIGTDIPSLTGTGASGTWGINISGNAATATSATTAGSATTATTATNVSGGTVSATTGAFSSTLSVTGATTLADNLVMSGSAKRITGDFSNATISNRVIIQTSTMNGNTAVTISPSGTAANSSFFATNNSDVNNASTALMRVNLSEMALISGVTGTGTYLPMAFLTNNTTQLSIATSGTATFTQNPILNAGSANGVVYLNGSKVATSGSALTYDGNAQTITHTSGYGLAITRSTKSLTFNGNYAAGNTNADINSDLPISFSLSASEQMRLTSTGLGIGTSSPAVKLDVSGADGVRSRVIATSGGTSGLILSSSGNTAYTIKAGNSDNSLRIDQDGTDRITLASGGNLGIGTSSPGNKLQVNVSSATTYSSGVTGNGLTLYNTSTTNNQYVGITLQGEPTAGNAGIATIMGTTTGSGNMDLVFSTRGSSTLAERARIDSSGNLGLGTTPTCRFDLTSTASTRAVNWNSTGSNGLGVSFSNSGTDFFQFGSNKWVAGGNLNDVGLFATTASAMIFGTNSTERARITSAGAWSFGSSGTATGTSGQVLTSNGSGSAPSWQDAGGPVKAWVRFSTATGASVVNASFNVSSVTYNGTGDVTVNFTSAMSDANYAFAAMGDDGGGPVVAVKSGVAPTTTALRLWMGKPNSSTNNGIVGLAIFR